jgi:hypothetical protein
MLGLALVRLIESHSETLARGVAEQIVTSERTSDFREIPPEELQQAATEVYRNLGEWLLQKTERDIKLRFETIATRRAHQGGGGIHHRVPDPFRSPRLSSAPETTGVSCRPPQP